MVRPVGRPMARTPITLEDLREEFLAHREARNLSSRTIQLVQPPDPTIRRLVRHPGDRLPVGSSLSRPWSGSSWTAVVRARAQHGARVRPVS
jgi:hypothetical protein